MHAWGAACLLAAVMFAVRQAVITVSAACIDHNSASTDFGLVNGSLVSQRGDA
jgi:hypothetical protein